MRKVVFSSVKHRREGAPLLPAVKPSNFHAAHAERHNPVVAAEDSCHYKGSFE